MANNNEDDVVFDVYGVEEEEHPSMKSVIVGGNEEEKMPTPRRKLVKLPIASEQAMMQLLKLTMPTTAQRQEIRQVLDRLWAAQQDQLRRAWVLGDTQITFKATALPYYAAPFWVREELSDLVEITNPRLSFDVERVHGGLSITAKW